MCLKQNASGLVVKFHLKQDGQPTFDELIKQTQRELTDTT
jgi:hypothetical protein